MAQKRNDGFCPLFCLGQGCPPALTLMPDTSVPSFVPLVPFKLLPWCWSSEGVSLSKCVYGFFKENCLGLQKFLPLTQSPLVFAARSYGDLSSWHRNPGLIALVWGWDPSLPWHLSPFLSTTHVCGSTHSVSPQSPCLRVSVPLPLLPVWINVTSLILWLSDFHTA